MSDEYTVITHAIADAVRKARILNQPYHVLKGTNSDTGKHIFFVVSNYIRNELYTDRKPVHTVYPNS